jgi:amino acid transporter
VLLVSCVIALLSLINIASSAALNAILSLTTLALYVSYLIPIGLLVIKRLRRERIHFGPWRLGKFGLAINIYALVFGIFIVIFLPFPASIAQPLTMDTMNYAGPVFLCVILLALGDWFVRGWKDYQCPAMDYSERNTSLWSDSKPELVTVVVRQKLPNV